MKEKIVLKSMHPELYGDLEVECTVIENDKIGEYLANIPEERKFIGYKNASVSARKGIPGEVVKTTLKTIVDGKEYILSEEENIVKIRPYKKDGKEINEPDVVVTNIDSTSNEVYVVKHQKFVETYDIVAESTEPRFSPVCDPRVLTQVEENIIIITAWGSKAVCLKGGYIVTYDVESNDYNAIEKGAVDSTYTMERVTAKTNSKK